MRDMDGACRIAAELQDLREEMDDDDRVFNIIKAIRLIEGRGTPVEVVLDTLLSMAVG